MLLASRLDVVENPLHRDDVDLLAVAAEEAARVDAHVEATGRVRVTGDERLLRRALRNLLENARRYGGGEVEIGLGWVKVRGKELVTLRGLRSRPGVSPRRCASASSSRSFACPGMPSRPAASASAWRSSSRSPSATAAACAARVASGGGSCFVIELPAG